jgi:hypothetical protein
MIGIEADKIRSTYKIPDSHEPLTAIALGYPITPANANDPLAQRDAARRPRKPLSEIVIQSAWGQSTKLG